MAASHSETAELVSTIFGELLWLNQHQGRPLEELVNERFTTWQRIAARIRSGEPLDHLAADVALVAEIADPSVLGFITCSSIFWCAMGFMLAKWDEMENEAVRRVREQLQ